MLRFCDSFDHYTNNDLLRKWSSLNTTNNLNLDSNAARSGPAGLWINGWGDREIRKNLDSQATWIVGVAFRIPDIGISTFRILTLRDGSTNQIYLHCNSVAQMEAVRGDGTVLGASTTRILSNRWYYLELKTTIHNSAGTVAVRLNENLEINLSSQDTQNTANATADTIMLGDAVGQFVANIFYDDLYVLDGQAGKNDFLGDIKIEYRAPNGNGNSSQFTGSDGNSTDNYLLVDEADPNDDTDYVESSTVGHKDTYTFQDLTNASGTVHGVQMIATAKKTDAGTRQIAHVARSSTNETDGATHTLTTEYVMHHYPIETKPGGGAYSISDFNSAEFGYKVIA